MILNLSNVVKNDIVKKTGYDELEEKVNVIKVTDTGKLVKKSVYNAKISEFAKLTKHLINGYSIFNCTNYFPQEDGPQNYLIFSTGL